MTATNGSDRLAALIERLRRFAAARDWEQFHDPKNLAMAIASESGELLSELRWVSNDQADAHTRTTENRDRIESEVADIAILLLLFCERTGIDLLSAISRKIHLNEARYPVQQARGNAERPVAQHPSETIARIVAVDWSGVAAGGRQTIWLAEVVAGELVRLENGRSRTELVDEMVDMAQSDPNIVFGLDFAFGCPEWFLDACGLPSASAMWAHVAEHGEKWLRDCEPPFWGRPGRSRPAITEHFRKTELGSPPASGSQPKSVFQIGGAGAVGTGSIRGMPQLARLQQAGFSIWPFDSPRFPLVVEIYPRHLTGPVVKSDADARRDYLAAQYPALTPAMRARAAISEDAFDAAVSALAMWEHRAELVNLAPITNATSLREGVIWAPQGGRLNRPALFGDSSS
jgi:NTP pyrophosphatase (non-canonical NTP hydrolase)